MVVIRDDVDTQAGRLSLDQYDATLYAGSEGIEVRYTESLGTEFLLARAGADVLAQLPEDTWVPADLASWTSRLYGYFFKRRFFETGMAHMRCLNCKHALIAHEGRNCLYDVTEARYAESVVCFDVDTNAWRSPEEFE